MSSVSSMQPRGVIESVNKETIGFADSFVSKNC